MAENNVIISAEEEAKLLKPIDEYVGKIQAQIDALRVEGSDKVNSLKNQIAIAKENKNLTKEQQNKIIEESKKQLEKAKATEDANKELRRKQKTAALKKLKHSFRKSIRKHLEA
mgnify:CR=1 FL=1